mgnify:CR=1 FL=1
MKNLNGISNLRILSILASILGIIILIPIIFIIYENFASNTEFKQSFLAYFYDTFHLILLTSFFCIIFGIIPAWIITFLKIKYKFFFDLLLVLPLAIPGYIMAFIYSDLFGYGGIIDFFLEKKFNQVIPFDVLSINWLSLFLSFSLFPYVYSTARVSFSLIGNTYINLSESLGVNTMSKIFKVIIPLSLSAIVSGLFLVIMEILNEYGAAEYFGIKTFSVGIFKYWWALNDKNSSIFLSFILLFIVIVLIFLNNFFKKNENKIQYHIKSSSIILKKLKNPMSKFFAYLVIGVPIIFGLFIPLLSMTNNVIKNFSKFDFTELSNLIKNSLSISITASFIIVAITLFILIIKRYSNSNLLKFIIRILSAGYAIPGAIIGLSIMLILQQNSFISVLMGTTFLLIYAYVFRFIAVAIFTIDNNLKKQPYEFDRLADSLKLNNLKKFIKINLPLSLNSIIIAFLIVFIDIMKELPLTLILRKSTGKFNTLAIEAYNKAKNEELANSSLYSLTIVLICIIMIIVVNIFLKRKKHVH